MLYFLLLQKYYHSKIIVRDCLCCNIFSFISSFLYKNDSNTCDTVMSLFLEKLISRSLCKSTKPLVANESNYLSQAVKSFLRITDRDDDLTIPLYSRSSLTPSHFACFCRLRVTTNDFVPEANSITPC